MERRRVQLDSAALKMESGWNYGWLLMAAVVGLVLGLFVGFRDLFLGTGVDRDERYLVLSAALYSADQSMLPTIRQRLATLGFGNASYQIIRLSERYAASRDRTKQREADGLRLFGEALGATTDSTSGVSRAAVQPTAASASPALAVLSTATPQPTATAQLTAQPTPAGAQPTQSVVAAAQAQAQSQPPGVAPTPTAPAGATFGTTKSSDRVPIRIRAEASTQSAALGVVPYGTKVEVLRVVKGNPNDPGIDPTEVRWYNVRYGNVVGYVYYKLLALGE